MKFDPNLLLAIIGTTFLVGSNLVWLITFYVNRAEKKVIERREFGHIKNNQQQLITNLANFFQDIERKLDDIKSDIQEIKFECRIDKK